MRVFIDPGHGGLDPGATANGLCEKDLVLEIACRLSTQLATYGHLISMSRYTDKSLELSHRADKANDWLADIFLSIHLNADPDPDEPGMPVAKGSEIWFYPGSSEALRLATAIANVTKIKFLDRPFRGIKEARFAVLRLTRMPAALLELAFIDNPLSLRLKDERIQELIALTISEGVKDYFDLGKEN